VTFVEIILIEKFGGNKLRDWERNVLKNEVESEVLLINFDKLDKVSIVDWRRGGLGGFVGGIENVLHFEFLLFEVFDWVVCADVFDFDGLTDGNHLSERIFAIFD
jgi:hypothetical protein